MAPTKEKEMQKHTQWKPKPPAGRREGPDGAGENELTIPWLKKMGNNIYYIYTVQMQLPAGLGTVQDCFMT